MVGSSSKRLPLPWRLILFWSLPALLAGAGMVGYRLTERWSWFDSLYSAVVTLTSIGHGNTYPFTRLGRALTLVLAFGGVSTFAVAATELLASIVTGELAAFLRKWRMQKRIDALEGHVIVCGYGHIGPRVCAEIASAGVPVVVVDRRAEALAAAREAGALTEQGDAAVDETLKRAGIARARALVAVAGGDSDSVLITMTARLLQPRLAIVARAEQEDTVHKLLHAGATRAASPHAIAGGLIAQAVLHPAVIDAHLELEEQLVGQGSPLDGKTVGASGLRAHRGHILVAIRRGDGQVTFDPDDDVSVAAGDTLITLSRRERLDGTGVLALSP
jgi:voltage-gated potassium channel